MCDNVKNVVFISANVHASLVSDARIQTLERGGRRTPASST